MTAVHSYSLSPLDSAHISYLFVDKETGAEKGFGLLTRAREEGERFQLRELNVKNMGLIEEMFKKVAVVGKSDQRDENALEDVKSTVDENRNSSNTAIIKAKVVVEELVNDLVNKQLLVDATIDMNKNYTTSTDPIDDEDDAGGTESNYAMMMAEMTPSELVDELLFGFKKKDGVTTNKLRKVKKKLKKKRLIQSPGNVRHEPRLGKDSKLKLPPGWDRLGPAQLAEQMKTLNSLDDDSPGYGRVARVVGKMGQQPPPQEERHVEETIKPISEKQRFRKRKREALKELNKSNFSKPMKLPRNWDQCSPESLAAQLKSKVDINGNSLTKVLEKLDNVSKIKTRQPNPAPAYQLPANWAESDPQSLAENIKSSSTESAGTPDLGKILDKLQNKKAGKPARKTGPIVLPANWEKYSPQALAENIEAAAAPGQQVTGLLSRLAAPVERAACPGTRQVREEHIRLPADWENSLARPADLADKIKAVNGNKNIPPALLDRLRNEDHKFIERKSRADEPVRLPANWEDSLSRPADLADKIRAVNTGKNVPQTILDRLRSEELNSGKRKVEVGSSTRPLVLPHNWYNSSSQELSRKLRTKLSKTSTNSKKFSELFSRLERKRSQTKKKSVKAGPIKLPADWEYSSSQELLKKISSCQNVDQVCLSKLQANMNKPRVVETNKAGPIKLPTDWATSSSQELLEKISSCQNVDQVCLSKIQANITKPRAMETNKAGPIKLPADWATSSSQELLEKISSRQNVDQDCLSKLQANMTRPRVVETNKSLSSAVMLPPNWESSPEELRKVLEERNSNNQEISKVLQNLEKNKDHKLGARSSKKRIRTSRSKVLSDKNAVPVFKLPTDWSSCNFSELAAKISSSQMGQNSASLQKIVSNLKRSGSFVRQDPNPVQSAPVRLPANWSNCSPQMLAENIKKQNLKPHFLSSLLANLQRVQQPDRTSDKSLKVKKSKKSRIHDRASDSKPNPVKLPANWENASQQQLAESLKMQNMDASVKSTLLAKLAQTKLPNQDSRKSTSSDKHGRNRTRHSKASNAARREVNTKKPVQLPPGWENISPDILAQELSTEQSTIEGLGKVIKNLQTQKRESEKPKEGIKKRKVVHQKQTKRVHKKIRKERTQLDKERRNGQKKKATEFSTVLKISEEERVRLLKPAQFGWRRECFLGVTQARLTPEGGLIKEKIRMDIYYWPPSPISKRVELPPNLNNELKKLGGKRIKNIQEMKMYLETNNIERETGITLENFSFKAKILDLGDFEYQRYTEHARQHLAERERVKHAKNDEGWVVEHLEDVNNDLSEVTQRREDLFGDISDLEDDFEDMEEDESEKLPKTNEQKLLIGKIKELSRCAEVDQEGSLKSDERVPQSVEHDQDSSGLKDFKHTNKRDQEGTTSDQKTKVQKKEKERITLVVECIDLQLKPLSLSVKPKRPVSQALNTFCTKYKLEMEDLQFWCGERRLTGQEKNSTLEERNITVSLAPARRKSPS